MADMIRFFSSAFHGVIAFSVLSLGMTFFPDSLQANIGQNCTQREDALEQLATRYAESPIFEGVAANGGVVEVLSSKSGETWTILMTLPNGVSCFMAAGENWDKPDAVNGTGI